MLNIISACLGGIGLFLFQHRKHLNDLFIGIKGHKQELVNKINRMPFIYRNIDMDILSDFVKLEMLTLDGPNLTIKINTRPIEITEKIKSSRKMLILGDAGIGKTTFLRHTALKLCQESTYLFFNKNENLVPIYVPLKAVDNDLNNPIIDYILKNNSYFNKENGRKKLFNLAKRNRLLLLLDGYDEISLLSIKNFIAEEICYLVDPNSISENNYSTIEKDLYETYNPFKDVRVWITSRREFFQHNPITAFIPKLKRQAKITSVKISGVSDRSILVQKIFNKYKNTNSILWDKLSTNKLITNIDKEGSTEIKELSSVPLFLTVICYVYIDNIAKHRSSNTKLIYGLSDLIIECIKLLVIDLDDYKARDLSPVTKVSLLDSRNSYEEAKMHFLPYFAWQLYTDNIQTFSIKTLKHYALIFFNNIGNEIKDCDQIITELIDTESKVDICTQLIYSGLFSFVDIIDNVEIYDFPHRRFKEVLAVTYLSSQESLDMLIQKLENEGLSEFILMFFSISSELSKVIDALIKKIKTYPSKTYYTKLLFDGLKKCPNEIIFHNKITELISSCLKEGINLQINNDTLIKFPLSKENIEIAKLCFTKDIEAYDVFLLGNKKNKKLFDVQGAFELSFKILHIYDRSFLYKSIDKFVTIIKPQDKKGKIWEIFNIIISERLKSFRENSVVP